MGAENYPRILLPVHDNDKILKVFNILQVQKKNMSIKFNSKMQMILPM